MQLLQHISKQRQLTTAACTAWQPSQVCKLAVMFGMPVCMVTCSLEFRRRWRLTYIVVGTRHAELAVLAVLSQIVCRSLVGDL